MDGESSFTGKQAFREDRHPLDQRVRWDRELPRDVERLREHTSKFWLLALLGGVTLYVASDLALAFFFPAAEASAHPFLAKAMDLFLGGGLGFCLACAWVLHLVEKENGR